MWHLLLTTLTPFLPAVSLLHSSKLLRESSALLLHLAFQLPRLCGKGSPRASWLQTWPKPRGSLLSWLPHLGLNTCSNLPPHPHFLLLPQSATPASIPVFLQLSWAGIVTLGMLGPVVWSEPSSSSQAGAVTRESCLPVTFGVKITLISLAQSMATAI